ncbi:uncharacterized protein LOC131660516 [Vicia villosa]|uniref:uncharacterized protein LOC131660516 n=1 Tax=Vicia villosa TaxID=3911 RepID=UPI00273AC97F|nr:uncharacterized protein LOC131660516 [Vicia villosa]
MLQQSIDSKFCDYNQGNSKMDLPNAAANNTSLTHLLPTSDIGTSSFLKEDKDPATNSNTPSSDHPLQQSPPNNAANGHLVYVRRKSEGEMPKNTPFENTTVNASSSPLSTQLYCQEEIAQPKPHINVSCVPPFAPFPMASSITSSGNPSIPVSHGKSGMMLAPLESNYVPPSSGHTIANPKLFKNVHWEERYQQLQLFLRKLDQSDQADYIQMLQSLSSVELSRHAVELEKRSIQLSLEEAKELQRVAALNVLGKSVKNFKAPVDHGECSDKLKTLT